MKVNELGLYYKSKIESEVFITSPDKAVETFRNHFDSIDIKEYFYLLCINTAGKVVGISKVSEGGITECTVDIRIIMQTTLLSGATRIIVAHNHPSGTLKPSQADIRLTQRIKSACEILNIRLEDHIILTESSYYSFSDEGDL